MGQILDQFGRPLPTSRPKAETRTLFVPSERDRYQLYPRKGMTPGKLANIMREADAGYPQRQVELFSELPEADGHILSLTETRQLALRRLDYSIIPASEESKDADIAAFCQDVIDGLEDFDDLLDTLADATLQGWAMVELGWESSSGQAVISEWEAIPQGRTRWDERGIPRLGTDAEITRGVEIPAFKVAYHTRRRRGLATRQGLMRTVSWWWLFKSFGIKDWSAYSEIFGMPLRVGRYGQGASKDDIDKLAQALIAMGTDGSAVIPESAKIEFVEATKSAGTPVYERLANYCDATCSKAILGQTLTSDVGKIGSYGAAKVHDEVRKDLRDADANGIAKTARAQLLRPLVIYNYGPDTAVPWFKYDLEDPEDQSEKVKIIDKLVERGLRVPTAHVYEVFSIPAPAKGEEVLSRAVDNPDVVPAVNSAMVGQGADQIKILNTTKQNQDTIDAQSAIDNIAEKALESASKDTALAADKLIQTTSAAAGWDDLKAGLLPIFRDLNLDRLADVLGRAVLVAEMNGRGAASLQANSARYANSYSRLLDEPVDPEEAWRYFERLGVVDRDTFDGLADDAKLRAFTVAGVIKEDLLTDLYQGIDVALREGATFEEFKAAADEFFQRRGLAGPKPWHLETVFRNNVQTAYMAGRYKQMTGAASMRPYWQYAAVMDGATRPAHAAMNGKVYHIGHPVWNTWYPPNGHNCRCDIWTLSEDEVQARGLQVQASGAPVEPDMGWAHNCGEVGWGRGLVNAVLGIKSDRKGWAMRPDLVEQGSAPPARPDSPAVIDLPESPDSLKLRLGSEDAVRDHYRAQAETRIGFGRDNAGELIDMPVADNRGNGAVIAARSITKNLATDYDLTRGRFIGLAREVVENADEVWLVPGSYGDGAVSLRRRYIKFYNTGKVAPRVVMAVAECERGVWTVFNTYMSGAASQRKGLLL